MVFSRAFCFDLIIKGDKAARDACAEISPFFGLVGRTDRHVFIGEEIFTLD